jgi:hypothetical protein
VLKSSPSFSLTEKDNNCKMTNIVLLKTKHSVDNNRKVTNIVLLKTKHSAGFSAQVKQQPVKLNRGNAIYHEELKMCLSWLMFI